MTLDELRESARTKADEMSTGFVDNDQLDRFLNQGMRFVRRKIVQRFEDDLLAEGTTTNAGKFDTVVGTASYSLPTAMVKLVKVEIRSSSSTDDDDYQKVLKQSINTDRRPSMNPLLSDVTTRFTYFLTKDKIVFRPVPQETLTVRLWFVPRATDMALTTDEPDFHEDFHELVAEFAALQTLGTSGEDLFKERMELFTLELEHLIETVETRDAQPEQMSIIESWDDANTEGGYYET